MFVFLSPILSWNGILSTWSFPWGDYVRGDFVPHPAIILYITPLYWQCDAPTCKLATSAVQSIAACDAIFIQLHVVFPQYLTLILSTVFERTRFRCWRTTMDPLATALALMTQSSRAKKVSSLVDYITWNDIELLLWGTVKCVFIFWSRNYRCIAVIRNKYKWSKRNEFLTCNEGQCVCIDPKDTRYGSRGEENAIASLLVIIVLTAPECTTQC